MWKVSKSKVLLDDTTEEENHTEQECKNKDQLLPDDVPSSVSHLASKVQGASLRGWTSLFNKDDEHQLLTGSKPPKGKGNNLKLKEDVKGEKKPGFWDSLVPKQTSQSKKADEIEGWEPPQIIVEDTTADTENHQTDSASWSAWERDPKGSSKYTNLVGSGSTSSRWSIKSAGKLVGIRKRSKGNLTDDWEELE
ncbi:testis development-related protein [Latimeria chalumnae]|uniref:Testis development related protein n=1 Tax=Latimeria chalumnae TaxID=7897 RepID=H3ANI1_LATCH|nr:PREDICTED: testis development-related protein [Latimeria chalumnae]|eukprot:XP_006005366.1 PREDICTED: testis development-related protein [Latimeria chalumnae]